MAALDWSQCSAVESIPGKVSGAWVFKGTRTPVALVFENLEHGMTIDELIEQFSRHAGADQGRAGVCRSESESRRPAR
jgi:uncharacterized protein (DUF433 family)